MIAADDNKIIQGLWIGPTLSQMEQLSIASFLANGHEYHLFVYDDVKTPQLGPRSRMLMRYCRLPLSFNMPAAQATPGSRISSATSCCLNVAAGGPTQTPSACEPLISASDTFSPVS